MFKNLTLYRMAAGWTPGMLEIETALQAARFTECGATQDLSFGWVPPSEENGALVESVAGQRILKLLVEFKTVPASAVLKHVKAAAAHIEQTTGRKPGRKEMKQLKDDAQLALLPQAFPKQSAVLVWIDHDSNLLAIDAGSQNDIDLAVTALVKAFDGLALTMLQTNTTPLAAMTQWLADADTVPAGFTVGRETELKAADESRAAVRFKNHHLDTDEVKKHITEGKLPTRLALELEGRVAFTLTEGLQLKGITYLDGVFDDAGPEDDGFYADVAIATGEMRKLIPDLVEALGGEFVAWGEA